MLSRIRRSTRPAALALAMALIGGGVMSSPVAAAPPPLDFVSIPIVGATAAGDTFAGVLRLTSFRAQDGQVFAVGAVSGIVTTAAGVATSVLTTVSTPITIAAPTCPILHLDLGPLALDVLGLNIDLSRVVLDITAEPGPGRLLGNLLCQVAGLLDSPGALARLLNQILSAILG